MKKKEEKKILTHSYSIQHSGRYGKAHLAPPVLSHITHTRRTKTTMHCLASLKSDIRRPNKTSGKLVSGR